MLVREGLSADGGGFRGNGIGIIEVSDDLFEDDGDVEGREA